MLLVLIVILLIFLWLMVYFGRVVLGEKKIHQPKTPPDTKISSPEILKPERNSLSSSPAQNRPDEEPDKSIVDSEDVTAPEDPKSENSPIESFEKTPEGSPKSTSSCISSEILMDTEEEVSSIEQASSISRPSSFPMDFSSPPYFNFTRKTPELIPRMLMEEFELLDKSIEKRKMDIRDLLRRIESAKRRHRRFSEHIQRVQRDHHIEF